jgi:hypothetical protein
MVADTTAKTAKYRTQSRDVTSRLMSFVLSSMREQRDHYISMYEYRYEDHMKKDTPDAGTVDSHCIGNSTELVKDTVEQMINASAIC